MKRYTTNRLASTSRYPVRSLAIIGALIITVAGIGAYVFATAVNRPASPGSGSAPSILTIGLPGAQVYCPTSVVWSPDGRHLAVLGTATPCISSRFASPPFPSAVSIFNTRTGKREQTFLLTDMLRRRYVAAGTVTQVAWTPDGRELLALADYVSTSSQTQQHEVLMWLPLNDQDPRFIEAAQPGVNERQIWDLRDGSTTGQVEYALPLALDYRLTTSGEIVTDHPLDGVPPTAPFTGRPTESGSTSLWQAGQIVPVRQLDAQGHVLPNKPPVAQVFAASTILWSSDGRYVALDLVARGPVAVAQPIDPALCSWLGELANCRTDPLPLPDPALATVIQAASQGHTITLPTDGSSLAEWDTIQVAWSADGHTLATILPGDDLSSLSPKATVTLLSTNTGRQAAQYSYQQSSTLNVATANSLYGTLIRWSPDGRLALVDSGGDAVTIWNVQQ